MRLNGDGRMVEKSPIIEFELKRSELTPVYAFLMGLGGFNKELVQIYKGLPIISFNKANFINFRNSYLAGGEITTLKVRLGEFQI